MASAVSPDRLRLRCACASWVQAGWRAARMRTSWIATTTPNRLRPTISAVVVGYTSASPATINITRSIQVVRLNSQPCTPPASAAIPSPAVIVTSAIEPQSALPSVLIEPVRSSPTPEGSSTNMKGTRNAGMVYFHDCIVVLYGSPPVIAAAANGESAVGGETSESTA